jgi:fatty-acyl-CoA synthase
VPHEIEHQVAEVDGVRRGNVAAFGVRDSAGSEGVVIVAEAKDPLDAQLKSRISLQVRNGFNTRPVDVVLLRNGELPKTTSGKLQRQLCKQTYLVGGWSR